LPGLLTLENAVWFTDRFADYSGSLDTVACRRVRVKNFEDLLNRVGDIVIFAWLIALFLGFPIYGAIHLLGVDLGLRHFHGQVRLLLLDPLRLRPRIP
jgi:hypothetical protein